MLYIGYVTFTGMEYKFYRDLYAVVCEADDLIKGFFTSCRLSLEWGKRSHIRCIEDINNAEKRINAIKIDVELRFPSKQNALSNYNLCFSIMLFMLDSLSDFVGDDGCCTFEVSDEAWISATKERRVDLLLEGIADVNLRTKLEKDFKLYLRVCERIEKYNLAQTIKEQIATKTL